MRIGLIAPPWVPVPPPAYGGTEAVIDRLARGIVAAGHEVLLFTTGDSTCPVPRRWVYARAETARMGSAVVELRHLLHAYDAMDAWGADVVHDHTVIGPLYSERFGDLPVVTTNHGPFNSELGDIYREIHHRVGIIAISHSQRAEAPEIDVVRVIHHGLDPGELSVGAGDGGYVAFLARMAPDKGAREAAEVAALAGVPLKMAAKMREPAEREYFDEHVRPLLSTEIQYVGEVGGADKVELLGHAMALLNPIQWEEPFGLGMIESLACGTPVLSFARGAAPEILEHGVTGFLCDDVDDMAKRLTDIDTLDRRACRAAVETRFSTARVVAEHLEVYADAVSRRRGDAARLP